MTITVSRRAAIAGGCLTLGTRRVAAAEPRASAFTVRRESIARRRVAIVIPKITASTHGSRMPLLLLLHGLGETGDPEAGVRAWTDRYGLVSSLDRLAAPPVAPTTKRGDMPTSFAERVTRELGERPLPKFAVVCPHMPNLQTEEAAKGYAAFVRDLLTNLSTVAPEIDTSRVTIGGCSLGGFVSLEVYLASPDRFAGWAGVQTAIGESGAERYAERLHKTGRTPKLFIATSTSDPYRAANETLLRAIEKRGLSATGHTFPGPHDQPWLREVGTLALLHWYGRSV